jgi:hypothetical protein
MANYYYTVKTEGNKVIVRTMTSNNYITAISVQPSLSDALTYIRRNRSERRRYDYA